MLAGMRAEFGGARFIVLAFENPIKNVENQLNCRSVFF